MPGKFGFKYAYRANQIVDVLKKIADTGRPDALTLGYMQKTWLLKDAQYSAVLDLLKDMKFLDGNKPTALYGEYQNREKSKRALAKGIQNAYPELFKAYPNAYNMPNETLTGYFKQQTGSDDSVITKTLTTFKKLCSLADFDGIVANAIQNQQIVTQTENNGQIPIPITMNIQIAIPADATAEQYDKIFSSIKKNLINGK
jgi:hypothetical protein